MNGGATTHTITVMGTFATIHVAGNDSNFEPAAMRHAAVDRAFAWFHHIEERCSRFEPGSELSQLAQQVGVPVPVSEILFEAVQFALAVADESGGAFDPTVGADMEARGFNREYRTRRIVRSGIAATQASYRDLELDPDRQTITLRQPLMLDLGAVAKGLAIDMAARELASFASFAIDAGGDLFLGGCGPDGAAWRVGIRHPRRDRALIDAVRVSNRAVCTSGDYERRNAGGTDPHHIIDSRTRTAADALASATVIAPTAMLADVLSTAAFALGPREGIQLLERHGVEGLLVTPALERHATRGFPSDYSILQDTEGPADDRPGDPAGDRDAGGRPQPDVPRPH